MCVCVCAYGNSTSPSDLLAIEILSVSVKSRLVFRYRYLAVPINDVQLGAKVPEIPYTNRTVWWGLVVMLFLFVMVFAGGRMSDKCWVSSLLNNILCRYHTSESTEPTWYVTCTCMNNLQYSSFQFPYLDPRFGSLFWGGRTCHLQKADGMLKWRRTKTCSCIPCTPQQAWRLVVE